MEFLTTFRERIKSVIADVQSWFGRLTQRERRLVAGAGGTFVALVVFVILFSFSSAANGYRRRIKDKSEKLEKIQALEASYHQALAERQALEQRLAASQEVRLTTYVQEKGEQAGLNIPTLNPKGDAPLDDDGKIVESAVEITMIDIKLNQLHEFLNGIESAPGIVKVKYVRLEPRPQQETLTAWATVAAYKMKP